MKYSATYNAKTGRMKIWVDDLPASKHEFDTIRADKKAWRVTLAAILKDGTISREIHTRMLSLAGLRIELDALDATRYKELSFSATAN